MAAARTMYWEGGVLLLHVRSRSRSSVWAWGLGLSQPGCDLCDPWLLKHMRGSPLTEGPTTAVTDMRDREWPRHRPRCLCLAGTGPVPPLGGAREPPGSPNRSLVAPPAVQIASASRPGAPWAPWWVSVSQIVCLFLSLSWWCREVHCSPLLVTSDRPPGPAALPVIQPGGDVHHARCRTHMPTLPHLCHRQGLCPHLTEGETEPQPTTWKWGNQDGS